MCDSCVIFSPGPLCSETFLNQEKLCKYFTLTNGATGPPPKQTGNKRGGGREVGER